MKRIIHIHICNAHSLQPVEMGTQLEILKGKDRDKYRVELEDGTWLDGVGDGRYCTSGKTTELWAAVCMDEVDDDGEPGYGEVLGYTRVY